MTDRKRITIKFAGESGQGVNSLGEIMSKLIKNSNLYVFAYREYPSLIKGGFASYQLNISDHPISSTTAKCQLLVCQSRSAVHEYLQTLEKNGKLIHTLTKLAFTAEEQEYIAENAIETQYVDSTKLAIESGGNKLMGNMILLGMVTKLMGADLAKLEEIISIQFASKPDLLEKDLICARKGFDLEASVLPAVDISQLDKNNTSAQYLVTGNEALTLGAIAAGTRVFYGYPMTPSSSILTYAAALSQKTGIVVKQAEDEITAVQMAIGSMFMGTRAVVATSGGGFDLMTETISLAGITETPLVCILGQRPGPATGMPTWTAASDLNLAIYAGHGEFPRCVIAISDAYSAFSQIQHALNISEEFQIPVIVLSEKHIAEGLFNVEDFSEMTLDIKRSLTTEESVATERYADTPSGISPRWLPGVLEKTYLGNSDEHLEDGDLTEDAAAAEKMMNKRMRKLSTLKGQLPLPRVFGNLETAKRVCVGWGSTLMAMNDVLATELGSEIAYIHYDFVYPVNLELLRGFVNKPDDVFVIENNQTGQFANLLEHELGVKFHNRILKYNGRPFFFEELVENIKSLMANS